jgi:hypothetical protein
MYESEKKFFDHLVEQAKNDPNKPFTFPKRCKNCRIAKRRDGRGAVLTRIAADIRDMVEFAESGDFGDEGIDRLISQMKDFATRIDKAAKDLFPFKNDKNPKRNHETHSDSPVRS